MIPTTMFAQAPDTLWTKTFGGADWDEGNSIRQTFDGGYIMTGSTRSFGAGGYDVWLIKTDAEGNTLWTKAIGNDLNERCYSIQQTIDAGYIITGERDGNVWLIKTDANGDTLWTRIFGDSPYYNVGSSVRQTADAGYIITGEGGKVWLIKTDANGDTLWQKTFSGKFGHSVQQTLDGGYILAGSTNRDDTTGAKILLIKTNAEGDTLWTKTFEGNNSRLDDYGNSVQQTVDGGYIITGTKDLGGESGFWLIKTNMHGDTLWTRTFWGSTWESGNSVQQTNDGGYIVAGEYDDNVWLIKTDTNGDTLWTKTIGGSGWESANSVQQTNDGGYIVAGFTLSFGAGSSDAWLIKIAPDVTSIDENPHVSITDYQLKQNFPNPFNPTTTIEFSLPHSNFVKLNIYNILGEEVATLVSEELNAGNYKYQWDAGSNSSGVYIYKLTAGDFTESRKMILLH